MSLDTKVLSIFIYNLLLQKQSEYQHICNYVENLIVDDYYFFYSSLIDFDTIT